MRDHRFIAVHRGGPLAEDIHQLLATWAATCADHVLPYFEAVAPGDDRPRKAIETGRAWGRGEIPVGVAQKASVAAHAAARSLREPAAVAAARAAGQAVATAHFAEHSIGALIYALKAAAIFDGTKEAEFQWQVSHLPPPIRHLVLSGLANKQPSLLHEVCFPADVFENKPH